MKVANVSDWMTDEELVRNGAPLELGDGRTLYVKRAGARNRAYFAARAEVDDDDERGLARVYARTIVCGWAGFKDATGATVPWSPEECAEVFEAAPEIFAAVVMFSAVRANFRAKEVEHESAQVKKSSGGAKAPARSLNG